MNILITGNLSSLARTLANELAKQKHRVVLASQDADNLGIKSNNIVIHSIDPATEIFRDAMASYRFDAAVFISTREEQLWEQKGFDTGHQLDELLNTLELCKSADLKHLFYISSTEVYGNLENRREDIEPIPASINGHTLLTGEVYCKFHQQHFGSKVTILRVPYIYGPEEKTGFLHRLIRDCKNRTEVELPGGADTAWNFLHVNDVADFLKRAIDEEYSPVTLIVNLASSVTVTNSKISEILHQYFPKVIFRLNEAKTVFTGAAEGSTAKKVFDWVDLHQFETELDQYADAMIEVSPAEPAGLRGMFRRWLNQTESLKWVELLSGAILTQYLSQLTGTMIQYKYVDFRLLFVVIMGLVYGLRFGLLAALLVSLSLFYTWFQLGIDWRLLIYNVGNWFPIVLYFVTGLIVGYTHDRTETTIHNEKKKTDLIFEKYRFLFEVFNEIRKLKDEFREQVIGYRDSFGKIYAITRELDTLQEQDVYFRALSILEDLMENDSIAIYRLEPDRAYARLEVNSTSLGNKLAKSLKLSNYPEAVECIEKGTIFQNTALLPDYPAYVAPIFNNSYPFDVPVVLIVIWSVKFEQFSTYYYNLYKVICGLIQASLLRATKFLDANYEKTFLPSTRIMNADAFSEVLRTRAEMSKNKMTNDQLIMIERCGMDFRELYIKLSEALRATDLVGMRGDGECYVLLSQADKQAAAEVIARLEKIGLTGRLFDSRELAVDQRKLVIHVPTYALNHRAN